MDAGHETAVDVALALELVLEDDEEASVEVEVGDDAEDEDELLAPDEVEEADGLMSLAPHTDGELPADPRVDLR